MDQSLFKHITVNRGLDYRYYFSAPTSGKPVLLFLHGFPSTSYDWIRQIKYFQPKGYGIVALDMLGFGRTSRPVDVSFFRGNLMAADVIDILDKENIPKVVGVAHDWGCKVMNRLSWLYPQRFVGFGWLGLAPTPPADKAFDLAASNAMIKTILGYEQLAYWNFFDRDDAAAIIEKNIDSFIQLIYPKDPDCWITYMTTAGKTAEWIEGNMQPGVAEYMTKEELDTVRREILDGGIRSGLNYYKAQIQNIDLEDDLKITPVEGFVLQQPCFMAAAHKDHVCTPALFKPLMEKYAKDVKIIDVETGHWLQFEASDVINKELEAWIQTKFNISS